MIDPHPDPTSMAPASPPPPGDLALVLPGGGARAGYQVGVLRYLAGRYPDLRLPILSGVSAGAINTALIAQHHGTFGQAVDELASLWMELTPERVFRVDTASLLRHVGRWGTELLSGGAGGKPRMRGMVDARPLARFLNEALGPVRGELTGIDYNLHRGALRAVAISTTNYTTGQSIVWTQGRDVVPWDRPLRRGIPTRLKVNHILASAALPLFFPAVRIGTQWYGDGGIRLAAPLSPALHLGAGRILAVSARHVGSAEEGSRPVTLGYPPPAQVLGVLLNAIFLDLLDQDANRLERINRLLKRLPVERRDGMRPIELLVLRPSQDLGRLAGEYEPRLPRAFRFLTRGFGTRQTASPDMLSMVMFQHDYLERLIELGEADAASRADEIDAFLEGSQRGEEEALVGT